ncbi:adenosine deaminase [Janibacter indicus]|uniref:adenosine deaminase n=1 Tax=Janibacter indicus TaxID=857417 RepID=UPI003D9A9AE9
MSLDEAAIRALPKVVLHDHLDGGLRPATVLEIADQVGHELPVSGADRTAEGLARWFRESADSGSLERYLETFAHTVGVMQTAPALRRVARESVLDLARDGVVYAESRYAPEQHLEGGLRLEQVVEEVDAGFREGEELAAAEGRPIVVRSLLTAMRHAAKSREIAELAVRYRDRGVAGFDIAGAEAGYPPSRHLDAFEYLRRENAHFTIHAGEAFGLPSIWEALQWCGADRLGHGVRIVDDIGFRGATVTDDPLAANEAAREDPSQLRLGRLAAFVRDTRVPLEDVPAQQCPDRGGAVDRGAPDHPAGQAALPDHAQHRQPADVRHVDDPRDARPGHRGGLGPRRPALGDDQCDEVGLPPLRRASGAHRGDDQARLCRRPLTPPECEATWWRWCHLVARRGATR